MLNEETAQLSWYSDELEFWGSIPGKGKKFVSSPHRPYRF
jgi:hypothetical protein